MTHLTFSAGLSCDLYANGECTGRFGSSHGKVKNVQEVFDVGSDPKAKAHMMEGVGSFFC